MKKGLLLLSGIVSLCSFSALADDTSFGGEGSTPMPIQQTDVSMDNEVVIISGQNITKPNIQGAWSVDADFNFTNLADQAVQLVMGMPFPVREPDSAYSTPQGVPVPVGGALVYHFTVRVAGKPVATHAIKIAANPQQNLYYQDAYVWPMRFAPKQSFNVDNRYLTGITLNVLGNNLVSYVIKTGALWHNGTIGSAHFEVIPNTPTRLCSELSAPEYHSQAPTPPGVQIVGSGSSRKYVWQFRNYHPTQDLQVCLMTGPDYVHYLLLYPVLQDPTQLKAMTPAQWRLLKNSVYAQYGRRFKDPQLQQYFNQQWWYQAKSTFSEKALTADDWRVLALLQPKTAINRPI